MERGRGRGRESWWRPAATLLLAACAVEGAEVAPVRRAVEHAQGSEIQGSEIQGSEIQGSEIQGHSLSGMTLGGTELLDVRVERGELVAERPRGGVAAVTETLRGAELVGAELQGRGHDHSTDPPTDVPLVFRIAAAAPEDPAHEPLGTGHTWLYTLEQWVPATASWQPMCKPDADGRRVAIPFGAVWDDSGARVESLDEITFGCTSGVLAKCYRWGYRPWVEWDPEDPDVLRRLHQACTRMARADYCGDGTPHTRDGTLINLWDTLEPPIQLRGDPGDDWLFEAAWNESGAVCLSRPRWLTLDSTLLLECPHKLRPLATLLGPATVCPAPEDTAQWPADVRLFNDSQLHLLP